MGRVAADKTASTRSNTNCRANSTSSHSAEGCAAGVRSGTCRGTRVNIQTPEGKHHMANGVGAFTGLECELRYLLRRWDPLGFHGETPVFRLMSTPCVPALLLRRFARGDSGAAVREFSWKGDRGPPRPVPDAAAAPSLIAWSPGMPQGAGSVTSRPRLRGASRRAAASACPVPLCAGRSRLPRRHRGGRAKLGRVAR
jgi:hypothetical protein